MYPYPNFDFSNLEIDQICSLVRMWASGDKRPIDARHITKQVREYAVGVNLLEKREDFEWKRRPRLFLTRGYLFSVTHNLPSEVLWRLVKPMLNKDGTAGYSITSNNLWINHFALYPLHSPYSTDSDLQNMEYVLRWLDTEGYIYFQAAGTSWSIHPKDRKETPLGNSPTKVTTTVS